MDRSLFNSIAQRLVVDYSRLSIVGNKDGFLAKDDVRILLSKAAGAEVVVGRNIELRIHYEQVYKLSAEVHYIYVCENTETLLADMRRDAYIVDFAITDMFPLFADKALLRKQPIDVLSRIYEEMGIRRVSIMECHELVRRIHNEIEIRRKESAVQYLAELQDVEVDWLHPKDTISNISKIMVKAIRNGVYDGIDSEITKQNNAFQSWVDSDYFATLHSNYLLHPKSVNNILPYLAEKYERTSKVALLVVDGFTYWQGCVLADYMSNKGVTLKMDCTLAWMPSITMLSRQAIFRGTDPKLEYKQSPENEKKLWIDYWTHRGYGQYEIQYICDKDEFAINESTMRLAVVTVEMDEKMH
ncbi:MAG: PglZ domain-containing protein, partial [Phocaeicola sp.]